MVRFVTSLLLICVTHTTCQYYDIFSGIQPFHQTARHDLDVTQKPRKLTTKARLNQATELTGHNSPIYQSSRSGAKRTQKPKNINKNDQIHFTNDYSNRYTTQNPFQNRPGVKPALVYGPPITNKPPVATSSPELILGPDVSYMSSTERRRHLDLAEKMCDKYKSIDVKQVQAIPLIPSPRPIKVNVSSCLPSKVPLVVGGVVVNIKEFPHMALLGWPKIHSSGYSWKCGGSLLSDRYVLTAAHCAYQDKDNNVQTGPPHAVQLGSSYLNDPGALVVRASAAIRHPSYKLPKSYNDIALIKLAKPVSFSEVIRPACLGTPPTPGDPIIATGWGKTEFGGDQSLELRSVSIPVWDIDQCREALGTSRKTPEGPSRDTQICAGELDGGKDTCQGDSGGPAQIQDGCVWRVVAVTSLGRACGAPRTPALYAIAEPAFVSAVVFSDATNKRTSVPSQGSRANHNDNSNKDSRTQNEGTYGDNQSFDTYNSRVDGVHRNKNPNSYTDYNQNTHNVDSVGGYNPRYETSNVKYINRDSYDAVHQTNQQNYHQTDKTLNQHRNQQNQPRATSNQNNYYYQNGDANSKINNHDRNNNNRNSNDDRDKNGRSSNDNRNNNNRNSNADRNNNDRNSYYNNNDRGNHYESENDGRVWWI